MTKLHALCEDAATGFRRFSTDQSGATAIEYAIIAAGVSIVIVSAVSTIGTAVNASFTSVSNGFN